MKFLYKHWAFSALLLSPLALKAQTDSTNIYELSLEQLMQLEVVTASQQKESLAEVPVPVTVITDEAIKLSGARNLRDLLVLFVPNMTLSQDHNEMNVAMRGVYASSQQKILVMLNGHRLNSRVYSEANPDYSISLEKIKQIEILRGPASSLYGNVALTAVVNIITKKGSELNGGEANISAGNYGQRKVSFIYGEGTDENRDFLFWGNYYQATGEKRKISKEEDYSLNPKDGEAILEGVNDLPSVDMGFNLKSKNLSMMATVRNGRYIEPFSGGAGTGEVYSYDRYRKVYGMGPGLQSTSANFDLKYEKKLNNGIGLTVNGYLDMNAINGMIVTNPKDTAFTTIGWREFSQGITAQAGKNYTIGGMKGDVLVGTQIDRMRLYDSFLLAGKGGEVKSVADNSKNLLLQRGAEVIYSGFAQVKHYFTEQLILNAGIRYDEKDRHQGENIHNLSPRIALIYNANDNFNVKASYSNSFVDGPYWYRYNSLASYKGSSNLLPERLSSWQITPSWRVNKQLQLASNIFYNSLTDFIYRDTKATGDQPRYRNAGSLKSWGWENESTYYRNALRIKAIASCQFATDAKDYGVTGDQIHNVPNITANINVDFNPLQSLSKDLWLNASYRYVGKQLSPIASPYQNGLPVTNPDMEVAAASLWNCGVLWENVANFSFSARVYNLFDTRYLQGGSTNFAYPQAGRWFLTGVSYKF